LYALQINHILFHLKKIIPKVHSTPVLWPFGPKSASVSCNDPLIMLETTALRDNVTSALSSDCKNYHYKNYELSKGLFALHPRDTITEKQLLLLFFGLKKLITNCI